MMKLMIELVPTSQWQDNLRSRLSHKEWDRLRRACYAAAEHRCEICNGVGRRHPVECHERWLYNDRTRTQTLVGLIALCPRCHEVKHFGLATVRGNEMRALEHFARVNELNARDACDEVERAFEVYERRSQHEWRLDLSWLEGEGR